MNLTQIAAEAWNKIARYYGIQIADGTGIEEIKAAIEKATARLRERNERLSEDLNHYAELESRAAHASEVRAAPDIITGEPIEFVQEAADKGAAHASEE